MLKIIAGSVFAFMVMLAPTAANAEPEEVESVVVVEEDSPILNEELPEEEVAEALPEEETVIEAAEPLLAELPLVRPSVWVEKTCDTISYGHYEYDYDEELRNFSYEYTFSGGVEYVQYESPRTHSFNVLGEDKIQLRVLAEYGKGDVNTNAVELLEQVFSVYPCETPEETLPTLTIPTKDEEVIYEEESVSGISSDEVETTSPSEEVETHAAAPEVLANTGGSWLGWIASVLTLIGVITFALSKIKVQR